MAPALSSHVCRCLGTLLARIRTTDRRKQGCKRTWPGAIPKGSLLVGLKNGGTGIASCSLFEAGLRARGSRASGMDDGRNPSSLCRLLALSPDRRLIQNWYPPISSSRNLMGGCFLCLIFYSRLVTRLPLCHLDSWSRLPLQATLSAQAFHTHPPTRPGPRRDGTGV